MKGVRCIAVLGPTCCWKSETALRLAERWPAEVISCDSMQVYRELSIGTAKPSAADLQRCPHHLVDCLPMTEPYDANRFVHLAERCLEELAARGKNAVLVGGTGLYARALIYGFSMLPADPVVSATLQKELNRPGGREHLMVWLEQSVRNPEEIPGEVRLNPRRLLRACEVLRLTGKPPWESAVKNDRPREGFLQFCLLPPLALLKDRIRARAAEMIRRGWLEEALAAEKAGLMETQTARQALGYRDIIEFFHRGAPGGTPALQEILSNRTIQYARRQMTWFRHQHPGAVLLEVTSGEEAWQRILQFMEKDGL